MSIRDDSITCPASRPLRAASESDSTATIAMASSATMAKFQIEDDATTSSSPAVLCGHFGEWGSIDMRETVHSTSFLPIIEPKNALTIQGGLSRSSIGFSVNRPEITWKTAGLETLYTMTDPTVDWIGSAIDNEVLIGTEKFAIETKMILHKNFGPLSVVDHGILEAEWEGPDYARLMGVLGNTLGACYQFNPKFFIGVVGSHDVELANWSRGQHVAYAGPNIPYRTRGMNQPGKGSFFATHF